MVQLKVYFSRMVTSLVTSLPSSLKALIEIGISIGVILIFLAYLMAAPAQNDVLEKIKIIDSDATYMEIRNFKYNDQENYNKIKEKENELISLESKRYKKFEDLQIEIGRSGNLYNILQDFDSEFSNDPDFSICESRSIKDKFRNECLKISDYDNRIFLSSRQIDELYEKISLPKNARRVSQDLDNLENLFPVNLVCLVGICPLDVPPNIIDFPFVFISGLFGSILFQLIISVYPEKKFRDEKTSSFFSRTILGGAISVALFTVLASGIAVLGASEAFAGAERNILALASVGVLAGMFSNRAAGWLSSQANIFLREEDKTVEEIKL
jgi:hypothetical protein